MLSQELYLPDLSIIDSNKNSYLNNNVFQLSKKQISEKQMILDILYMLLGLPGSILSKKSGSDQYQLPDKYEMTHLSTLGVKNGIKQAVKMCNQTKYIEGQTKRLYETSNNAVVKSFCEAVFDYLQFVKKYFSELLAQINNLKNQQFALQSTQQTQIVQQNKSIKWESIQNISQNIQNKQKALPQYKKITLLTITNIISEKAYMLGFIIRCLNTCSIQQQNKTQVVQLLDKMWEIQQQLLPYPQYNEDALVKIFKKTLRMFFINVKEWLKMNKIPDKMDFFILMPQCDKGNLSQIFLHKNTQIQPLKLPKIIQNLSKGVLQIGKTIRFIKLYYEDFQRQKLMNYLDIDQQFKILQIALQIEQFHTFKRVKHQKISLNDRLRNKKKQKIKKKVSIPSQNPYQMFSTINTNNFNMKWIQKRQKQIIQSKSSIQQEKIHYGFLFHVKCLLLQILQKINKKCLHFFRDPYDTLISNEKNRIQSSLSNTLIGIKKFMLLQQGDFVQQFLNATQQILDKEKSEVSHNKIYSCIDEAIENSSAKFLPKQILSNIHFDYIKQSDKKSERLRMWVLFCFNYRQDNPINYIFNNSMMQKLKDICNLIFKLKKGQLVLTKIWDEDRETLKADILKQKIIKRAKILRNSLIAFLNHCLAYLLNKIEVIWCQYREKIYQAPTVFDIVTQSVQVVTKIQKISTSDNLFFNGTMLGLGLVERFRKFRQLMRDQTIVIPIKEIEQLQFQLRSIAQIMMKIPELNQMINYNSYFDKID